MQTENKKILPFGEDLGGVKKYTLKPGRHQFAPGSPAVHHNDDLSNEEIEWYLEKYPHIASLFDTTAEEVNPTSQESFKLIGEITPAESVESSSQIGEIEQPKSVESPLNQSNHNHENLPSTN